jgi:AraC-like DNA-binding protein
MKGIPVDQLQKKTSAGMQIKLFRPESQDQVRQETTEAHRDDHYIFFLLTGGSGTVKVDLDDILVAAGQLYYILPAQVHQHIRSDHAEGWFLAVDVALIPPDLRGIFERGFSSHLPCRLTRKELKQYTRLLRLLHSEFTERINDPFYLQIIHALVQSFLAMAASSYHLAATNESNFTRSGGLVRRFKELLTLHCRQLKSPSAYAELLHVSPGYLNETIKKATGATVSYWIRQEIFSEARRLLHHTNIDVKQIAHELGYSDDAYFNRTFRKASGMSPLTFRRESRGAIG